MLRHLDYQGNVMNRKGYVKQRGFVPLCQHKEAVVLLTLLATLGALLIR